MSPSIILCAASFGWLSLCVGLSFAIYYWPASHKRQ